jgi:very-short-patch-repair endonuclease
LERAFAEAHVRQLTSRRDLLSLLARHGRRRGSPEIRRFLEVDQHAQLTRSQAEERFLALVRAAQLPMPDVNLRIGPIEVDFLWRQERLVVEVDGFRFHASRAAFERDRLRDAELQAGGLRVMRVTWRQLTREREATLARVARALVA